MCPKVEQYGDKIGNPKGNQDFAGNTYLIYEANLIFAGLVAGISGTSTGLPFSP